MKDNKAPFLLFIWPATLVACVVYLAVHIDALYGACDSLNARVSALEAGR